MLIYTHARTLTLLTPVELGMRPNALPHLAKWLRMCDSYGVCFSLLLRFHFWKAAFRSVHACAFILFAPWKGYGNNKSLWMSHEFTSDKEKDSF